MIVTLDLETSGLDASKDSIIEIALLRMDRDTFEVVDEFNSFVKFEGELSEIISRITHIEPEDLRDAPSFSSLREEIIEFIWDAPILWHNTQFDRKFLIQNGIPIDDNLVLDTFFLANFLLRDFKSLNLWYICSNLWIQIESEHRAIYDTRATAMLFRELIKRLQSIDTAQKKVFSYISEQCRDPQGIFYRNTYLLDQKNISTKEEIVSTILSSISRVKKPLKSDDLWSKEIPDIDKLFKQLVDFEIRENQKKMSSIVFESLTRSKKTVIEAPTWLGKTFAYLIPAIAFSLKIWEQVFISTSTKTLQDQIYAKDLLQLQDSLGVDFSFCKLKGKKNYLSLAWLFHYLDSSVIREQPSCSFLLKIIFWLPTTELWELEELDFYGEEYSYLQYIHAGFAYTFHQNNPYKSQEFIIKARDNAKIADIVIVNNNILFHDAQSEGKLLGSVKNLVIDEAHSLEDVITESCKKSCSLGSIQKAFTEIEKLLRENGEPLSEFIHIREEYMFQLGSVFEYFSSYLFSKISRDNKYKTTLIKKDFFVWFDELKTVVIRAQSWLQDIQELLSEVSDISLSLISWYLQELEWVQDIFSHIFWEKQVFDTIIPTLTEKNNQWIFLEYTVLNPSDFLQKYIWSRLDSVILTSATLQIEESFSYIENMYGLKDFDFFTLETDFDYAKQALVFVPDNLGSIKFNAQEIFDFLVQFFLKVPGNSLVLFTSVAMVQDCYLALSRWLIHTETQILAQSVSGSKQKQVEAFKKESEKTILLWTDGLWQWVDIPGSDLKYLIIHKIPFMVPVDPVFQARSVLFDDAFRDYSIPKSIMKLKQGFGRLIRTKSDTGVAIFLDDRIFSTRWGERYFSAFPTAVPKRVSSAESLLSIVEK